MVYFVLAILTIPFFFFWRRLFRKSIKSKFLIAIAAYAAAFAALLIGYTAIILIYFNAISYYPESKFDRNKWFADKEKRYELSQDIIESKLLIGKNKKEVR